MAAISQCIFVNKKICILIKMSLQFVPEGAINNHRSSIGLDYGLTPNRRQAIIWTNAEPIYWRIYAALGLIVKPTNALVGTVYRDADFILVLSSDLMIQHS